MTTEPVITVGEITEFCSRAHIRRPGLGTVDAEELRQALAAFLAKRVPDAIDPETERHKADGFTPREVSLVCLGHNACREQVLKGKA